MRLRASLRGASLVLAAGCAVALAQVAEPPIRPTPIELRVAPVVLNPDDARQTAVGRFVFAGGLELRAGGTVRFGGLSDLEVLDGRVWAVSDEGMLFRGTIVLDDSGRLSGLRDAELTPLTGPDGRALADKSFADSEGLTFLPNGDRLVSFERQHRIWRYPAAGGPPVETPVPAAVSTFPLNGGLEALVALPARGEDAYIAGGEVGMAWVCRVGGGCRDTALGRYVPEGFNLTAVAATRDGQTVALLSRSYELLTGVRARLRLLRADAIDRAGSPILDELALVDPLTRDNFEGVSIVERGGGALRLYLLSDNNYSETQRTLLLAFDWSPR